MKTHGIENEKIVFRDEEKVVLEFAVPSACDFFEGHFPQFKLLPAVGQFEIITRFSQKYFGTKKSVPSIKRIKFSSPVLPDSKANLEMKFDRTKNSVSFSMSDANKSGRIFSTGTFSVTT